MARKLDSDDRSKGDNYYSGVYELVGLKELAEYDPQTYYEYTDFLRSSARRAALQAIEMGGVADILINAALDKLFVRTTRRATLLGFSLILRRLLIEENKQLFIRAVLAEGRFDSTRPENEVEGAAGLSDEGSGTFLVNDLRIGAVGVKLHGLLETLKGIGLLLRDDLGDIGQIAEEVNAFRSSTSGKSVFRNVFVADLRPLRFEGFRDIALEHEITAHEEYIEQMLIALRNARLQADKVSRLYVPLLLNWARFEDLGGGRRMEFGVWIEFFRRGN